VAPEFLGGHVAVITHNLAQVLRRHVFLFGINISKLLLVRVPLGIELLPFPRFFFQDCFPLLGTHSRRHDAAAASRSKQKIAAVLTSPNKDEITILLKSLATGRKLK
jgi:hypothetical protein